MKEANFSNELRAPTIYLNNRFATKQRFCLVKNERNYAASDCDSGVFHSERYFISLRVLVSFGQHEHPLRI